MIGTGWLSRKIRKPMLSILTSWLTWHRLESIVDLMLTQKLTMENTNHGLFS